VVLEVKPASVAVHVRQADPAAAEQLLARIRSGPGAWDGVHVTEGTSVVELSVVPMDKGEALDVLRHRCGVTAAVFVGDDNSAEEVFARLAGPDLGIKVGDGATRAAHRVRDPQEAACWQSCGRPGCTGKRRHRSNGCPCWGTGVRWRC
jgi:trehalose 6-phosphate phosphatase